MQLTLPDATEFSQEIIRANRCKNSRWQSQPTDSPSRSGGGAEPVRRGHTLPSIISHYAVLQREGFPFSAEQCKSALYSRGCTASFLQDKRPLKKVPTWLLTVYYASSRECGMPSSFQAPVILMDNSPLWLNPVLVPSGEKGADSAESSTPDWQARIWSSARREFTVKTRVNHNLHWMQNFPVPDYSEEKGLFVRAPHISLHSPRNSKQNRTR